MLRYSGGGGVLWAAARVLPTGLLSFWAGHGSGWRYEAGETKGRNEAMS